MRRIFLTGSIGLTLVFTTLSAGCSPSRNPGIRSAPPPAVAARSVGPEQVFSHQLAAHLASPPADQRLARNEAESELGPWLQFEREARQYRDASLRHWYYQDTYLNPETVGVGLGNGITVLKKATEIDPSFAEAWEALGRLCSVAGDLLKARQYLDRAREVALARKAGERPVSSELMLEIYRQRAWVLRDLTLWNEGLEAVAEGLDFRPGDPDLVLIKGLLLAGVGRIEEAMSLAVRMPPIAYPEHDQFHYGTRDQSSDYANRWIKSQALLASGDYELARHVLGELKSYPYRRYLRHQQRFWNDVGLAAELAGDPMAGAYYAIGLVSADYRGFFPLLAQNLEPLVQDFPPPEMPYFTSFGGRFYIGGSILAFAAEQMNQMNYSAFEPQRELAAGRAMQALDIAERRNIRPDIAKALRGRIHFAFNQLEAAQADLQAAHELFKEAGAVDPGTSLLLGMLNMTEGRHNLAVPLFSEAVEEDPRLAVGWRSLGVSLTHLGRKAEAKLAMDRALELAPQSVAGLYNRGLLNLQTGQSELALADLERAFQLEPENHEIQRLLQLAAAKARAEGREVAGSAVVLGQEPPEPEEIFARLEKDIQGFFEVPDSLQAIIGPEDQVIISLEEQYHRTGDLTARKILALAYLDRKMFTSTRDLLSPGWGVDLSPEEEVMLLFVDRSLGEQDRSRELSRQLLASPRSDFNPYLLMLLPQEERKHWTDTILAKNHYFEGYNVKLQGNPDATRFARYMRVGFRNLRLSGNQMDVGTPFLETPFFRFSQENSADGGTLDSPTNGGTPVSRRKEGGVSK